MVFSVRPPNPSEIFDDATLSRCRSLALQSEPFERELLSGGLAIESDMCRQSLNVAEAALKRGVRAVPREPGYVEQAADRAFAQRDGVARLQPRPGARPCTQRHRAVAW